MNKQIHTFSLQCILNKYLQHDDGRKWGWHQPEKQTGGRGGRGVSKPLSLPRLPCAKHVENVVCSSPVQSLQIKSIFPTTTQAPNRGVPRTSHPTKLKAQASPELCAVLGNFPTGASGQQALAPAQTPAQHSTAQHGTASAVAPQRHAPTRIPRWATGEMARPCAAGTSLGPAPVHMVRSAGHTPILLVSSLGPPLGELNPA